MTIWRRAAKAEPSSLAFYNATVILDPARIHEIRPWEFMPEVEREPRYSLCAYPEDGICSLHLSVPASALARYLFP